MIQLLEKTVSFESGEGGKGEGGVGVDKSHQLLAPLGGEEYAEPLVLQFSKRALCLLT